MEFYHIVLMPIEVPPGEYCWAKKRICQHFSNEGGHPICDYNLGDLKYNHKDGLIYKPEKCRELREA